MEINAIERFTETNERILSSLVERKLVTKGFLDTCKELSWIVEEADSRAPGVPRIQIRTELSSGAEFGFVVDAGQHVVSNVKTYANSLDIKKDVSFWEDCREDASDVPDYEDLVADSEEAKTKLLQLAAAL